MLIVDSRDNPRPDPHGLWRGLNWIAPPHHFKMDDVVKMRDGPRCRPYIDYVKGFTRRTGMNYSGWRVRDNMGFIQLTDAEMSFASEIIRPLPRSFIVIEPMVKIAANPNKQWGREKWQNLAFVMRARGFCPVQIGPPGTEVLQQVQFVETPTFRHGCAVMKFASWSILPDGGLHHAAAALGLPATVLWGGTNDPNILGYPDHENIFFPAVCGNWTPCRHCKTIWDWVKPGYVLDRTVNRMKERYGKDYGSR